MSWSANARGTKTEVIEAIGRQLDTSADSYSRQKLAEGATVHAVRGALLHSIAGMPVGDDEEVDVSAIGSQSDSYVSLSVKVLVAKKAPPSP